jgi:membrane protein GlpM
MDVLWKGILGGLVTALIVLASKRGDVLAGILPLAPTFAIVALLAVGSKGSDTGFQQTCLAGGKTMPAYLAFLGTCYLLIHRLDFRLAILAGLGAWFVITFVIFIAPRWV